ncbi:hypothetical protein IQ07DRAFT_590905 [Pyrenochaeta sp. DS3sAY3a]|nr:hypothetical protein IQ07DRAFT_590905 [Pyrenochaeta sp. DS3sAY3a]
MKTGATPSAVPLSLGGYLRVYGSVLPHRMFAVNSEYGRIDQSRTNIDSSACSVFSWECFVGAESGDCPNGEERADLCVHASQHTSGGHASHWLPMSTLVSFSGHSEVRGRSVCPRRSHNSAVICVAINDVSFSGSHSGDPPGAVSVHLLTSPRLYLCHHTNEEKGQRTKG